ncbi:hypothetical protein SAMN05660772_02449 [Pasteurella testudinis DSM 23072]|uniref:Lipoprotein n=1 Tax=Pasteurella testudinis DSM 23072 TaxID=1122938 RepID=A0A1W1UX00_9PAST|nr:hypothetical protein [Pasteurella testudinis]SMB85224.1 hypothetical protein SAMN05660772_02449 [Pasteurella testudinis DSM 23072]SUB52138.1 Uncharacterised protein [Pasteurella testudinis]
MTPLSKSKIALILSTSLLIAACNEEKTLTLEKPPVIFNLAPSQVARDIYYWDTKTIEQLKSLSASYQQLSQININYETIANDDLPLFPSFSGFDSTSLAELKNKYQQVLSEAKLLKEKADEIVEVDELILKTEQDTAKQQHSAQSKMLAQYREKLTPLRQQKENIESLQEASKTKVDELRTDSIAIVNKLIIDEEIPVNILGSDEMSYFSYIKKPCDTEGLKADGSYNQIMLTYQGVCFTTHFKLSPQYAAHFAQNTALSDKLSLNFIEIVKQQIAQGRVDVEPFKNSGYQYELKTLKHQIHNEEIIARNKNNGESENQLSRQVDQAEKHYLSLVTKLEQYNSNRAHYLNNKFKIKFHNLSSLEELRSEMSVFYLNFIDKITQSKDKPTQEPYQKIVIKLQKNKPYVLIKDTTPSYTQYFFINTANLTKNKQYTDKDTISIDDLHRDGLLTVNQVKFNAEGIPIEVIYTLSQLE